MKPAINTLVSLIIALILVTSTPAFALWPHRKSRITATFGTLSGDRDSTVSVDFTASNGKTIVAHADQDGHISVSLSPGTYSVVCSRGDLVEWQAQIELRAGGNDLIDAIAPGTFRDLSSHKNGGAK